MTRLPNIARHGRHMTIAIRSGVFRIDADLRETIDRRVRRGLHRYARRISEVRVWLDDANGPRGGIDRTCRIQVELSSAGTATVECRAETVYAALAGAIERAKTTIDRTLKRRRRRARFPREPRNRPDGQNDRDQLSIRSGLFESVPVSVVEDAA